VDGFRLRLAGHGRDDSCVAASDNAVRIFALHRLGAELSRSAVSKLLPPITVNGIRYRVLRPHAARDRAVVAGMLLVTEHEGRARRAKLNYLRTRKGKEATAVRE
jgi:hypothetical protein